MDKAKQEHWKAEVRRRVSAFIESLPLEGFPVEAFSYLIATADEEIAGAGNRAFLGECKGKKDIPARALLDALREQANQMERDVVGNDPRKTLDALMEEALKKGKRTPETN